MKGRWIGVVKPVYVNSTPYTFEAPVFPHARLKYGLPPKLHDMVMQRGYNALLLFGRRSVFSCGTSYRGRGTACIATHHFNVLVSSQQDVPHR